MSALLEQRPARRPEMLLGPGVLRGAALVHVVKDRRSGSLYELGPREHFVLAGLDGTATLAEISAAYSQHFGRRLDDSAWQQLLRLFGNRDMLVTGLKAAPAPVAGPRAHTAGLLTGDVVLGHPSAMLHALRRRLRPLLRPWVLVLLLTALGVTQVVLLAHLPQLVGEARLVYRQPELVPIVFGLLWLGMLLHELGHGLSAVHCGGDATEVGLRWRLPAIGLFCAVEDVPLFPSRWHRLVTAAAGLLVDLAFEVPFLALWLVLPAGDVTRPAVAALLLLVTGRVLYNLLPLPPLDGYLMLSYALNISWLATESRAYLRLLIRRRAAGRGYPRWAAAAYLGYFVIFAAAGLAGAAAVCWPVVVWVPAPWDWLVIGVLALLAVGAALTPRLRARRARARPAAPVPPGPAASAAAGTTTRDRPPKPEETRMRPVQAAAPPAVVAEDVSKAYGQVRACQRVSLTVARGEMFGVLGPNGAGKTTLIEIMEGLRRPDSGRVTVLGAPPWPRDTDRLLKIGIQTQASGFFGRLTALEHLQTVAELYGAGRRAALDAVGRFGLAGSAATRVERLSGGQRQRLALAAAVVHDPDLVFLDEPTAALDPQARRDLWQLMREIRDQGKTIVYTTHHLDEAEALCDRVAILSGGAVVAVGEPQDLIGSLEEPVRVLVPSGRITVGAARALAGADSAETAGSSVVIATRAPGLVLSAVTEIAGAQGIRTRTATLEDVYLKLTGTEYQP